MTFNDMLEAQSKQVKRRKPSAEEHDIQVSCVKWFRYQYPQFAQLLFAVPNGGRRDKASGGKLKAEGVVPGVSDLILLVPNKAHHALLIEMKKPKQSYQSDSQREFQAAAEAQGYKYVVCRSLDDFTGEVTTYLR